MTGTMAQLPGQLPAERDSLVGRRRETAQVLRELSAHRVVTVTGPGGVGKTRVALRVARDRRRSYPDGVWFVALGNLRDPALLPLTVANAIGVVAPPAGDVRVPLTEFLASREVLLTLDNCEHLREACVEFLEYVLPRCPGLTVLATSREQLGLAEEALVAVPPLPTPDLDPPMTLTAAADNESVALFSTRASAVAPDFHLTQDSMPSVVQICHDLDGIPLAIELAAVRVRGLSTTQLAQRLSDRFRVLTAGLRDAPARHRTLQSCMQWSYDLCSRPEQLFWARASVFVGGFEEDAALSVCAGDGVEEEDVPQLLRALVEKSILIADRREDMPRYRMLETLREFGTVKMAPNELDVIFDRFVEFHRQLARDAAAQWFTAAQVQWFSRLDAEHANLQVALDRCLQRSTEANTEKALSIVADLFHYFWWGRAWQQEGRLWLRRALGAPAPLVSLVRGRALYTDCSLALAEGDFDSAEPQIQQIEQLAETLGSVELSAYAGWLRTCWHMYRAEIPESLGYASEVLAMLGPGEYPAVRMDTLMCQASTAASAGDVALAVRAAEEMESMSAAAGDVFHRGYATWLRGISALGSGDAATAAQLQRESLRLRAAIGEVTGIGWTLEMLAWAEGTLKHAEEAATLLGAADRLWEAAGRPFDVYQHWLPFHEACADEARSALGDAQYVEAFRSGRGMTMEAAIAYALDGRITAPKPEAVLSQREYEIAELISTGLTNREISNRLYVSERTVDGHVQRIYKKLGVGGRRDVASRLAALRESADPVGPA